MQLCIPPNIGKDSPSNEKGMHENGRKCVNSGCECGRKSVLLDEFVKLPGMSNEG
jgi:hypothetical protein